MTTKRTGDRGDAVPYNKDKRPRLNRTRESTLGTGTRKPLSENNNEHMRVFVRVRPFNARENVVGCRRVCVVENDKYLMFDPKENSELFFFKGTAQKGRDMNKKVNKNMLFGFNRVFDEDSTNEQVFEQTAKSIVNAVLEGFNCSVFAYGATGAGKTYTMLGTNDNPGINYRTIVELLEQVQNLDEWKVCLGASYIEVYNENVRDLLHPDTGMLQLREEGGRVLVAGLKVERICSSEQLFSLLNEGNLNRTQHPTDSNAESSRSHAIFQVHVQMENKENRADIKISKLSMIDLAGSERGAATGCKGIRFKEGSNINKSLLALGNCINALADGLRHVPYRDSKLTRILKDSLGGNCRTMMIANVSPSSFAYEDTYNTLKYATRAKSIKSKITKNVLIEKPSVAEYTRLLEELREHKQRLAKYETAPSNVASLPNFDDWEKRIAEVMEEKKRVIIEMLTLQSEEHLTGWRLEHKCYAQLYLDNFQEDDTVSRTQVGIDQLKGRLETFRRRLKEYEPALAENQEKEEALEKEIRAHPHASLLLKELEIHRSKIANAERKISLTHNRKIAQLQAQQEKRFSTANTDIATVADEMHSLLRAHGHLTKDLDQRYQNAVKILDGLKSVTFNDDENVSSPEHFKFLMLSMSPVHQKPVVTDEEMSEYKKKFLPLQERPQNKVNFNAPVPKSTLPRTPSKLFRSVNFVNKENAGVSFPQRYPAPGTPGLKGAVFKAVRNNPHSVRMHPYPHGAMSRVNKNGVTKLTPKPIRMNKLAAARMAAAVR